MCEVGTIRYKVGCPNPAQMDQHDSSTNGGMNESAQYNTVAWLSTQWNGTCT